MTYPADAISVYHELDGPSNFTIAGGTGVKYILGLSVQQENISSTSEVVCGSTVLARNYAKDLYFNLTYFRCEDTILIQKTGNDKASFMITYVDRDLLNNQRPEETNYIDVASNSAFAVGFHDSLFFMWTTCALLLLIGAFFMGTYFFRK